VKSRLSLSRSEFPGENPERSSRGFAVRILTYLLLVIASVSISTPLLAQRPNFVIIILDDADEKLLPPDGPSFINYPSIQRIYQEGLQVCNAYCLQPLCGPSRYSMLTGTYPHVHGATNNGIHPRGDLPTFFTIAASHGYHNNYVGKYSNVEHNNLPGMEKVFEVSNLLNSDPTMNLSPAKGNSTGTVTVVIDDTSAAWLAHIDTPFIFGIGHIGTHLGIGIVPAYANDYNGRGALPDNYYEYATDYPSFLYADSLSDQFRLAHDSSAIKNNKEKLLEIQSEINRGIENIFSVLQSRGILDNTMIIFTNDNGFLFGEHKLSGKQDAHEESVGVPLFIRYPAWFAPGSVSCGNMIGLHDIAPTILEAAGIDAAPYNFQGQSLHYLVESGHERTSIYLENIRTGIPAESTVDDPSWRAVRTAGFKYVRHHCQASVEELFDLTADPGENSNEVNNPAYADTLNSLRLLMDSLAIATIDTISTDTIYLPCTLISCQQSTFYTDGDGDGYGSSTSSVVACTVPSGYAANTGDCNDGIAAVHPGATEICNSIDDNCNGTTDEGCVCVITTGSVSGSPFCPEAIVNVPFTSSGTLNTGNIYTAQLSDKKGHFTAPIAIGTLNSTGGSGTIMAAMPSTSQAGTKYRVRVTSSNPAVTGTDNGANLQLVACGIVTALTASTIGVTSASLNWTGVSCAVKYKVQYRRQGVLTWTTKYSTTNSYTITGLVANTTYEYHVQTYCSESGSAKSAFTPIQTFITVLRLASGSASPEETMSMHPNPAGNQTVIQFFLPQSSHVCLKVYDQSGKEIETLLDNDAEKGDHSVVLNTRNFSKGVYLVKMISDSGTTNQKLIVE